MQVFLCSTVNRKVDGLLNEDFEFNFNHSHVCFTAITSLHNKYLKSKRVCVCV